MSEAPMSLSRFEILGELKRGGMGIVYRARDRQTLETAALKMVRVADKQLLQSIRREIHALLRINHPGVVGMLAEGVDEGMPWYAMEFVEAVSLIEHWRAITSQRLPSGASTLTMLRKRNKTLEEKRSGTLEEKPSGGTLDEGSAGTMQPGRSATVDEDDSGEDTNLRTAAIPSMSSASAMSLPPVELDEQPVISSEELQAILTLMRRVCIPLAYIHGEGLVHLDLKPDNILIRRSGMPVILDFGLATIVRSQLGRDMVGMVMPGAGTVRYMAPEQINGDTVDARADTYALGIILYQMLTGRVPFPGPSAAETVFGHLNLRPTPPSNIVQGIPQALEELVLRMLEKKPGDRIGYAQDIDRALARLGAQGWEGELPTPRAYVYRPKMAGRAAEQEQLLSTFAESVRGGTRIVLLRGESGIGKTRLVSEFARSAATSDDNAEVYTGEFRQQGGPLHGLRRILQAIADTCRSVADEDRETILGRRAVTLARYEPDFQYFVPQGESLPELLPDAARQLLFQDLLAVLRALSEIQPLVLILDDIQWADDLSLGFVEFVRAQAETAPIRGLLLATQRTGEPNPAVEELAARSGVVTMDLGRLDLDAVSALLADMLAMPKVSTSVAEGLFQHSEGNPLFLTEYLLESVAEDLIFRDEDGVWQARRGATQELDYARLPLPKTVNELIVHRLEGMGKEARRIAELSAVLGAEPDMEILERVAAMTDIAFFDALDELQRRHVLEQKEPRRLAFAHAKIREATYAQILDAKRKRMHLDVANTLANFAETHPARTSAGIAQHLYAGDDEDAALPYALAAGDDARSLYGHDEAERYYLRAIATQKRNGDNESTARTLMKLGLVHMSAFETDKARRIYDEAFTCWEKLRNSNPAAARTSQLTVATGEPMSLDPGRTYDTDSAFLQRQLFACLVEVDEESNVLPAVAVRWQISPDGKIYTFHLRPDARWSDGTPLIARHFEYAWRRNLSPQLASPAAALLDVLENGRAYRLGRATPQEVGVRAKGQHELEVRLAAPIGYLLHLLAHPIAAPVPTWLVEAKGNGWASPNTIVTNGAFRLKSWVHGNVVQMEANRHDVLWSRGNVRELHCRIFNDYRDALRAYEAGEVDMVDMVSANAKLIDQMRREHSDELESVPVQSTTYLVFRVDRPPFDDARVRLAFAHAIDRGRLAAAARQVGAQPATGGFVPPGIAGHSPDLMLHHLPDLARSLFAAAGCTPADFANVTWLHTHGIADPVILEVLCDGWRRTLDIALKPQVVRWNDYQERVEAGVPDVLIGTWTADFCDPDNFLRTVFHSGTGMNEPKWHSQEFDMLVDSAASRTDQGGRMNFYRAADRVLIVEEAAIVPLCYGREPVLVKPCVRSFPKTASWLRHLKNCWLSRGTRSLA